jgi:hypothetical protein
MSAYAIRKKKSEGMAMNEITAEIAAIVRELKGDCI